jgi:hypothetical protein
MRKPRERKPGGAAATKAARRRTARPGVEALEGRLAPTVNVLNHFHGLVGGDPPDACGAAGPGSYVETHNSSVTIFGKSGNTIAADGLGDFLFTQGQIKAVGSLADATMAYDEVTGQFIVADLDVNDAVHGSALDIAVSKTSNPATLTRADWNFYQITMSEANYNGDYPGNMGYNADAFVFTFNMFGSSGHVEVCAISQSSLAAKGTTVTSNRFDLNGWSMRPVTMHDSAAGGPMWLVSEGGGNNSINLTRIDNILSFRTGTTPPTFTKSVNPYGSINAPLNPDKTAITTLIDTRIMKAAEADNTIVACQHVGVGSTEDDVRWYAFNVSNSTNPSLVDQGNVSAGSGTYLVYPAIDINAAGDIGMSYIRSGTDSSSDFMSVYVTGRTLTDAAGTMEAPVLVQAGNFNGFDREGDFSGINVDADGTFWAANEYTSGNSEATEVAHFTLGTASADGNGPVDTWVDPTGTRVEHVFSRGANGHLMEAYWTASASWHWYDVSTAPGGLSIAGTPSVASWVESNGLRVETVFAQGTNGHLVEAYWSAPAGWHWYDVSTAPGGTSIAGNPCVTAWVDSSLPLGEETVFARGTNGHLLEAWWVGNGFHWYDVSTAPGGTIIASDPCVASWTESSGLRVETVFAQGTNGHLLEAYWWASNGWGWKDVSLDPGGASIAGTPCVSVWVNSAVPLGQETVFARGTNGHLLEAWWVGNGFHWYDVSTATNGMTIASNPCVASWVELSPALRVETVFAQGANGHLVEAYWSPVPSWNWYDVSTAPGGTSITGNPCVAVWVSGSLPLGEETVFARGGANSDLEQAWWIGNGFHWYDVSTAPGGTTISPLRAGSATALPSPGTAPRSSATQPGKAARSPSSPAAGKAGPAVAASRALDRLDLFFASRGRRPRTGGLLHGLSMGEALPAPAGRELA